MLVIMMMAVKITVKIQDFLWTRPCSKHLLYSHYFNSLAV